MRGLAVALSLVATPALAHHEVIVVTSFMPLIGGLATIAVAGLAAFRKRLRGR